MRHDEEWRNPANWSGGFLGIYQSKADARLVVPKQYRAMGYTLNFAHPRARVMMAVLVAFVAAGIALAVAADG